ncbi:MAG: hypothetical protein WAV95_13970 [Azonexus sp.]
MSIARGLFFYVHLAFLCVVEIACAQEPGGGFEGTWIIAPHPHDSAIENGLSGGEYPVLKINETGNVRAYRFGVQCGFDNMNVDDSEAELSNERKRCIDSFSVRQTDLNDAPATLVFEGQFVQESKSTWRLDSPDKSYLQSKIQSVKIKLVRMDEIPIAYFVFHRLLNKKLELNRKGAILTIHSKDGKWYAEFVKVSTKDLTDAESTLWHIFAPNREYFRCIFNTYATQSGSANRSATELSELRNIVQKYAYVTNAMDNLRFKMEFASEDKKHGLSEALMTVALERDDLEARLKRTPAFLASEQHRLGHYLNCGERDHQ